MPVVVYALPGCSSCRNAVDWLKAHGVSFQERHIRRDPPNRQELADLAAQLADGAEGLLSRRSLRFRELGLAGQELQGEALLDLLAREPHLLRRPILHDGSRTVVGFDRPGLADLAGVR